MHHSLSGTTNAFKTNASGHGQLTSSTMTPSWGSYNQFKKFHRIEMHVIHHSRIILAIEKLSMILCLKTLFFIRGRTQKWSPKKFGLLINKRITLVSRDTLITQYNLWYCNMYDACWSHGWCLLIPCMMLVDHMDDAYSNIFKHLQAFLSFFKHLQVSFRTLSWCFHDTLMTH